MSPITSRLLTAAATLLLLTIFLPPPATEMSQAAWIAHRLNGLDGAVVDHRGGAYPGHLFFTDDFYSFAGYR